MDKQSDRQIENISKQMHETQQADLQDVVKISKGEMGIVERNKKIETQNKKTIKKRKRHKKNQKLLEKETGLLLDVEG